MSNAEWGQRSQRLWTTFILILPIMRLWQTTLQSKEWPQICSSMTTSLLKTQTKWWLQSSTLRKLSSLLDLHATSCNTSILLKISQFWPSTLGNFYRLSNSWAATLPSRRALRKWEWSASTTIKERKTTSFFFRLFALTQTAILDSSKPVTEYVLHYQEPSMDCLSLETPNVFLDQRFKYGKMLLGTWRRIITLGIHYVSSVWIIMRQIPMAILPKLKLLKTSQRSLKEAVIENVMSEWNVAMPVVQCAILTKRQKMIQLVIKRLNARSLVKDLWLALTNVPTNAMSALTTNSLANLSLKRLWSLVVI